ncbi:MAG: PTS sugar transporter subunit IIB [Erysipelotrichaceae bacterium]|nr:PTS sugar transporter subunit IIB [Erysipelotrichaceae bacterium]MCI9312900.1 PTS sugar transporter subunit IIB [Erysipelotrichaceae bacterium]
MSTNMLMKNMKKAAEAKHLQAHIWAVGEGLAQENVPKADIILLGPQVRYLKKRVEEMAQGKPVMEIDMVSFGRLDGAKVLQDALMYLCIRK